jgi:hypothetical protein
MHTFHAFFSIGRRVELQVSLQDASGVIIHGFTVSEKSVSARFEGNTYLWADFGDRVQTCLRKLSYDVRNNPSVRGDLGDQLVGALSRFDSVWDYFEYPVEINDAILTLIQDINSL